MMVTRGAALLCAVLCTVSTAARADDLVLQGDAYGRAEPGMGLLVLQGQGEANPWVSAEAFVWGGLRDQGGGLIDGADADVLTVSVRLTEPTRHVGLRLGRFVEVLGAIRPIHLDGASAWARLPGRFRLEAFGGMPVQPGYSETNGDWAVERNWDWVVGTRLSRSFGDWSSVGLSYMHRRDDGAVADEEVGADAGVRITDWLEGHGRASFDTINPGFSEARLSLMAHEKKWFAELFGTHRSPSRLLPATSLFSVLGDTASEHAGLSGRYTLFPRLDLEGTAAVRVIDDFWGPSLRLATVLRLDPLGQSAFTLEARRDSSPDNGDWTGVRAALRVVIVDGLAGIGEVEMVIPDAPEQRGKVWPWALAGVSWNITDRWALAAAVQGESSSRYEGRLDGLVRLTHRWALEGEQ